MSEMNTSQLLLTIDEQRKNLAANLSQKGVAASDTEGLSALVPKVLDISGGNSGGGGGDYELESIIYSPTVKTEMNNFNFMDYEFLTVVPVFTSSTNAFAFKVPSEIGVFENIMPTIIYNPSYVTYSLYTTASAPYTLRLTDETTAEVWMPSFGTPTRRNFFDTIGSQKAYVIGIKKASSTFAARARKRTPANLIREDGNIIPLIINESMEESDVLVLFYSLEEADRNNNIYVINNPFVTQELIEVVQSKGYNVIQV